MDGEFEIGLLQALALLKIRSLRIVKSLLSRLDRAKKARLGVPYLLRRGAMA
jgi:hypothetical protein